MKERIPLSEDQKIRIKATLSRIKGGLKSPNKSQFEEPAHIFVPEAFDDADT